MNFSLSALIAALTALRVYPPATPGGGGSGTVESIGAGTGIDVDNTDPANPVVSAEPRLPTTGVAAFDGTSVSLQTETGLTAYAGQDGLEDNAFLGLARNGVDDIGVSVGTINSTNVVRQLSVSASQVVLQNGDAALIMDSETETPRAIKGLNSTPEPADVTGPDSLTHKAYVDAAISTVELTPGPAGEQGEVGPAGPAGTGVEDIAEDVTLRATEVLNTDDFFLLRGGVPYLVSAVVMSEYFGTEVVPTAPAALTETQWTAEPTVTPGQIGFNFVELPNDGGSPITALQYRVDGGTPIAFSDVIAGLYVVTAGLTAGAAANLEVRAVNAIGDGPWSDVKTRTPLAASSAPVMVQRTILPGGLASRGVYAPAAAVFPSDVTPGNTIIIRAATNGTPVAPTSSQVGDTPVMFNHEVFGGAAYWSQIGYIEDAVGGPTTISIDASADIYTLFAEEWANLPAFNAAAGVGVAGNATPLTVSTPNPTDVAVGVSFLTWTYFGNSLDSISQAVPDGFTLDARYNSAAGGNEGRAQLIGAHRAESVVGVKSADWGNFESGTFISTQIMVFGAA